MFYGLVLSALFVSCIGLGRSTLTCAQCRDCPDGWTGTQTCTGETCFTQLSASGNADRGCFLGKLLIDAQCNQTTLESDGTVLYHACCNKANLCNANTMLVFPSDAITTDTTGTTGGTVTCAECTDCPDGWTGTKTCTGETCFVHVSDLGERQSVDRGCFSSPIVINSLCNQTVQKADGSRLNNFCCKSSFCNKNILPKLSNGTKPTATTTTPVATVDPSEDTLNSVLVGLVIGSGTIIGILLFVVIPVLIFILLPIVYCNRYKSRQRMTYL